MSVMFIGVRHGIAFACQKTKSRAACPVSYRQGARFASIPFEAQENLKNTPVWLQHLDLPREQHSVKPAQAFESIDSDRERLRRPVAKCIYRYTPRPQFSEDVDCARDLSPEHFLVSLEPSIN